MKSKSDYILAVAALIFTMANASASPTHGSKEIDPPDALKSVDRSIEVRLGDNFFEPKSIEVGRGETVRFVLKNEGVQLHEFNLGTAASHATHQKEMAAMMQSDSPSSARAHDMSGMGHAMSGMKHDDPSAVFIAPGAVAELIWTFTEKTDLEFACNVPGHYQSGMHGKIEVR